MKNFKSPQLRSPKKLDRPIDCVLDPSEEAKSCFQPLQVALSMSPFRQLVCLAPPSSVAVEGGNGGSCVSRHMGISMGETFIVLAARSRTGVVFLLHSLTLWLVQTLVQLP